MTAVVELLGIEFSENELAKWLAIGFVATLFWSIYWYLARPVLLEMIGERLQAVEDEASQILEDGPVPADKEALDIVLERTLAISANIRDAGFVTVLFYDPSREEAYDDFEKENAIIKNASPAVRALNSRVYIGVFAALVVNSIGTLVPILLLMSVVLVALLLVAVVFQGVMKVITKPLELMTANILLNVVNRSEGRSDSRLSIVRRA